MKAKITKVDANNNALFDMTFEVYDDNGALLFTKKNGMLSYEKDPAEIRVYINEVIASSLKKYKAEQDSMAKIETEKLIGQELDI